MSEFQMQSGIFKIEFGAGHNLIATRGRHAVESGVPLIARGLMIPPLFQEWRIERTGESLPGQYSINLAVDPALFVVEAANGVFANHVPPESWTIIPGPKGFVIRSPKGRIWGRPTPQGQIPLIESNADPEAVQELWHFEHLGF